VLEGGEEPVLACGEPGRQLLQREERAADPREPDDVPPDPALEVDEQLGRPLLERERPRQREKRPLLAAGNEPELRSL
jgi:hypothetical protein